LKRKCSCTGERGDKIMAKKSNANFIKRFITLFLKSDDPSKSKKTFQYIMLVLLIGIAFMIFGSFFKQEEQTLTTMNLTESAEDKENASPAFGQDKNREPETISEYER